MDSVEVWEWSLRWLWSALSWLCCYRGGWWVRGCREWDGNYFRECTEGSLGVAGAPRIPCAFECEGRIPYSIILDFRIYDTCQCEWLSIFCPCLNSRKGGLKLWLICSVFPMQFDLWASFSNGWFMFLNGGLQNFPWKCAIWSIAFVGLEQFEHFYSLMHFQLTLLDKKLYGCFLHGKLLWSWPSTW